MPQTVTIPVSVLRTLQTAAKTAVEAQDSLEDYLLSTDKRFLARMRAARASHRARQTRPLPFVKQP
jgi:hypothetical protein